MIGDFRSSLADADQLIALHDHCVAVQLPGGFDDLLRLSLVYRMSALDKLVHDIIVHEMVETYAGRRAPTPKFQAETISLEDHSALKNAELSPPPELVFERLVRVKLSRSSFMDPKRMAEGLSLVWGEPHKWACITREMQRNDEHAVRTELRNLFTRRNAIVHETDRAAGTSKKLPIDSADSDRARRFVTDVGEAVYRLV